MFFVAKQYSALLQYDYVLGNIKYITDFAWKKWKADSDVYVYNQFIVAAGLRACQIGIYNTKTSETQTFYGDYTQLSRFSCVYDGKVWFFPREVDGDIISFDLETYTYSKVLSLNKVSNINLQGYHFIHGNIIGNGVWLNDLATRRIYRFDFDELKLDEIVLNINDDIYGITSTDKEIILASANRKTIYITDDKYTVFKEYVYKDEAGKFGKPLFCNGGVLLFSEDEIVFFKNEEFKKIMFPNEIKGFNTWFMASYDYNNMTVLFPWTSEYFVTIDWEKYDVIDYQKAVYPDVSPLLNRNILCENLDLGLDKYLSAIISFR